MYSSFPAAQNGVNKNKILCIVLGMFAVSNSTLRIVPRPHYLSYLFWVGGYFTPQQGRQPFDYLLQHLDIFRRMRK